jgi:hypothetical protein
MVLRGDAEPDPAVRLRHYVQAVETAPAGSPAWMHARRKRGSHVIAMSADAPMTETTRQDLLQAARELEELGDAEAAAAASVAYGRAGDVEGQARALARAGDVEKLDALLIEQQGKDREAHARRAAHDQVAMLLATGRRREAVETARASTDAALRERVASVEARRVAGEVVALELRGRPQRIVLGEEVVVGRVATISIASTAVSRRHVAVARRGPDIVVRDLGSRSPGKLASATASRCASATRSPWSCVPARSWAARRSSNSLESGTSRRSARLPSASARGRSSAGATVGRSSSRRTRRRPSRMRCSSPRG